MKKIFMMIVLSVMLLLTACGSGLIETETREVDVIIVDSHHSNAWFQPVRMGKVWTNIYHPEINYITVSYEGVEYTIDGEDIYDKYHDDIGETAVGILEIYKYDDGTRRYDIVGLK